MPAWCSGCAGGGFPSLQHHADRIAAMDSGAVAAVVNLVTLATDLHLLFMPLRDGGPPASYWAGRSRSEPESKAQLAVGPTGGDQPNILPLDLIFYF